MGAGVVHNNINEAVSHHQPLQSHANFVQAHDTAMQKSLQNYNIKLLNLATMTVDEQRNWTENQDSNSSHASNQDVTTNETTTTTTSVTGTPPAGEDLLSKIGEGIAKLFGKKDALVILI